MRARDLALLALCAGCERPAQVAVICHNANCTPAHDADRDDTLAALEASLALGPAVLDGVELDLVFDGACGFAHDLDAPAEDPAEAAARVAEYVRAHGEPFHLMIELKRGATDLDAHADCALDVFEAVEAARDVDVIFESFEPAALRALAARPRFPGDARLGAALSIPAPLGYSHTLDDFDDVPLDVVDVHPAFTSPADRRVYDGLGLEVALWTEGVDTELFDALLADPPAYVVTSEAPLVRAWLDR